LVIVRKPVAHLTETALARFVSRACQAVKLKGSVNVMIASSRELRSLNRQFRGKDKVTDVLSFPVLPGWADGQAGDVAISADIAAQNARALGHSPADEVKILALHGVLHLAGYDHEQDSGEMARKENKLRQLLGLPIGLIQRNSVGRKPPANRGRAKAHSTRKR
jgi:probable rRNA maturation factor